MRKPISLMLQYLRFKSFVTKGSILLLWHTTFLLLKSYLLYIRHGIIIDSVVIQLVLHTVTTQNNLGVDYLSTPIFVQKIKLEHKPYLRSIFLCTSIFYVIEYIGTSAKYICLFPIIHLQQISYSINFFTKFLAQSILEILC